ncbi:WD40-like Beta Propeller Repeat [Stigmatella aurantiaca]|uniref:WD40-like Beta Propeller Repeat n=1 Tax=Stigmatella aurantiaca TaxID=41 RepID=A0A1H7REK2_STIAU|nr:PD40 domain-containing protein [Stigmatella aurantiaca]SEL58364.1 WD40-like Beta Propeller Repeat [Stigmatella aurantiaca]
MLTPRGGLFLALAVLFACAAWAQDDENDGGLRTPTRLTVGMGDHFLGQLEPDGKRLIFVSNRNIATEIYAQELEGGRERRLFDEGADVTWPRVSPDGKHLLYISFRDQAGGQLCVRNLPAADDRRCLEEEISAVQAEWIDASHVALVSRAAIQGGLHLSRVDVAHTLSAKPLLERNLTSPTLSPDGRWLVYVPIKRAVPQVGPGFAARAARHLEALRLDRPGAAPIPLTLDLPGQTGQPVFARDGRSLYVVQFFTDSNGDEVIDASDSGVLFRVPFATEREDAPELAAASSPDQLTSVAWNCEYPAPAAESLIATCSRDRTLDVYQLPLDGQVPSHWDVPRLNEELRMVGRRADQLLLYRQRLLLEARPKPRRLLMMRLSYLHLAFEDFEAAGFYARGMLSVNDPATAGLAEPLQILIGHRRAMKERERGQMMDELSEAGQQRMQALEPTAAPSPPSTVFQHVVRSELAEDAGDFTRARQELEAAQLTDTTPRAVLEAWFERADSLYRKLDDRDALVEAGRRLSLNKVFHEDDQLDFARAAVRALYRGRPYDQADAAMAQALALAPAGSAYAFALEMGRRVNAVHDERPPRPVRDALIAFYEQQQDPLRRRALVQDAVERAASLGADGVMEALATVYVDDTPAGTEERRRAERLFRRALTGRAYRRLGRQRLDNARADFDLVTQRTGSLESAVESINLRLRAGTRPEVVEKEVTTTAAKMAGPLAHFVKAYLMACQLPELDDETHAQTVSAAVKELRMSWKELKGQRAVQALSGAIHHEDFLRRQDPAAAERANRHYLIALDLVRNNVRYRAMILGALGLLNTQVGNFHIALEYLEQRDKFPAVDNAAGLAVSLARARALLHTGREEEAAKAADQSLARLDDTPELAGFALLALDRAALYNLAAGRFERALALYDRELPLLEAEARGKEGLRNRLVVRLARGAAALGAGQPQRALEDLAIVDRDLADPAVQATLGWRRATPEHVMRSYRIIAAGLRANAETRLGRLDVAARALKQRRALFLEQFDELDRDQDVGAATLAELRLAENAVDRRDMAQAARWLGEALAHADTLIERTHAPVDAGQLGVLWFAAQLHAEGSTPLPFDVPKRLGQAHRSLIGQRSPAWRSYLAWFEIYLALGADPLPSLQPARSSSASGVLPVEPPPSLLRPAEPRQRQTP